MEDATGAEYVSLQTDVTKPVIIVASVVIVGLVVTGNGLVISLFVLKKEVRTPRNMYIAFLALTDLLVGVVIIPLDILHEVDAIAPSHATCKVLEFLRYFVLTSNLYCVVAIATDRYQCIVNISCTVPSMKRVYCIVGLIWICSALYAVKGPLTYDVVRLYDVNMTLTNYSTGLAICGVLDNTGRLIMIILDFLIHCAIPVSIITTLYVKLAFWVLKQQTAVHGSQNARYRNFKVIKMVLLMVILYIVCQLPAQVWRLYVYTGNDVTENRGYILDVFMLLTYTNSWINVVVYAVFNDALVKRRQDPLLCCKKSAVTPSDIRLDTLAS